MTLQGRLKTLTIGQIFAMPLLMASLLGVGLVAALFGDGFWDLVSAAAILAVLVWTVTLIARSKRH